MERVNIEYDNFIAVEESHVDSWRVHNGETWAHGFKTKERAIEFAERVGGDRVAYCKKIEGRIHYVDLQEVAVQ